MQASAPVRAMVVVTALLVVGAIALAWGIWRTLPDRSAPTIQLDSISNGSSIALAVRISGNRLARAELWADDILLARETNPDPLRTTPWDISWRWQPSAEGVHQLAVRAFDASGRYAGQSLFRVVTPPSGEIVFVSNRDGGDALYKMAANGDDVRQLMSPENKDRDPAPTENGTLAFASQRSGSWNIWLQRPAPAALLNLTPDLSSAQTPVWSPDHSRLAFTVTANGLTGIVIMSADGKNRRQLTMPQSFDGQPTWSPAGDEIAFASERDGNWDVYRIKTDGTGLVRLTDNLAQDWQPTWSPRGDKIAFTSNRNGTFQIYVMNADGSQPMPLTEFPNGAEQPAWSPDGRWLAFVAYTGEGGGIQRREIYLALADGSSMIRLTQNAFADSQPTWVP